MVVKTPDGKLAAVLITDTGLIRLVHDDPFCDEHTAKVGTKGHQCRGNAIGGYYDPIMNDIFGLGALVYCIAFNERLSTGEGEVIYVSPGKSTKRKTDAAANRVIRKLRKKLQDRLGLDKTNELLNTLYTTERDCPTLEEVLACEFLTEGSVSNGNAGLASIDEEDVTNGVAMMEISGTVSEAEIEMYRMLLSNELDARAKFCLVSWETLTSNYADMGPPFYFQVIFVEFFNKCSKEEDGLSFTGIPDFLDHFEAPGKIVSRFLSRACNRNELPNGVTTPNACTTGAKRMATSIKDAVVAKIDELNGAGEALVFDELDGIVADLFSAATGFDQIEDTDRRSLCRLLFAVHLDHVENED